MPPIIHDVRHIYSDTRETTPKETSALVKDIDPMPIPTVHPMTIELTSIEKQFIIEHDQTSFLHTEYTIYSIDCARGICMNPNCTFMQD